MKSLGSVHLSFTIFFFSPWGAYLKPVRDFPLFLGSNPSWIYRNPCDLPSASLASLILYVLCQYSSFNVWFFQATGLLHVFPLYPNAVPSPYLVNVWSSCRSQVYSISLGSHPWQGLISLFSTFVRPHIFLWKHSSHFLCCTFICICGCISLTSLHRPRSPQPVLNSKLHEGGWLSVCLFIACSASSLLWGDFL